MLLTGCWSGTWSWSLSDCKQKLVSSFQDGWKLWKSSGVIRLSLSRLSGLAGKYGSSTACYTTIIYPLIYLCIFLSLLLLLCLLGQNVVLKEAFNTGDVQHKRCMDLLQCMYVKFFSMHLFKHKAFSFAYVAICSPVRCVLVNCFDVINSRWGGSYYVELVGIKRWLLSKCLNKDKKLRILKIA